MRGNSHVGFEDGLRNGPAERPDASLLINELTADPNACRTGRKPLEADGAGPR